MRFPKTVSRAKPHLRKDGRGCLPALRPEFELDDEGFEDRVDELVDPQRVAAREGPVLLGRHQRRPSASVTYAAMASRTLGGAPLKMMPTSGTS